jgi:YHS domain-containing protein
MRFITGFLSSIVVVSFIAISIAPSGLMAKEKKAAMKEVADKNMIPVGLKPQTACPVMGGKLDGESYVDYQGQRIRFCCAGCEDSFIESPEKYFEKAAKDSVMFENVQTTCPVMGNPIDRKYFTYYKGRGIYFCCASCVEKFKADPEKYLGSMGEGGFKKGEADQEKKCAGEDKGHECDGKHGH